MRFLSRWHFALAGEGGPAYHAAQRMGTLGAIAIFAVAATGNAAPQANYLQTVAIIVGVVSGVSGFLLGILNYLHQRDKSRPHIVVRPRLPHPVYVHIFTDTGTTLEPVRDYFGIMEVCNVGYMPVVISHVGFLGRHRRDDELLIDAPESFNGMELPGELKPQHNVLLRFKVEDVPDSDTLGRAVAVTAVGDVFKASRRAMREFAREREAARLRQRLPGVPYTLPPTSPPPGEGPGPEASTADSSLPR